MGTISVFESVCLDGVMQAPGRADEDTRGGFRHGGWGVGYADEVTGKFVGAAMGRTTAMLFGHRTYDDLLGYWTSVTDPNPFTEALVNSRKYVVSRDADTKLAYPNSTLLAGDARATVARLKDEVDGVICVLGSGALVRSLQAAGLVEEYVLLIHPHRGRGVGSVIVTGERAARAASVVERTARASYGRLVALLAAPTGGLELAEDTLA